jgi:hypothetical protein
LDQSANQAGRCGLRETDGPAQLRDGERAPVIQCEDGGNRAFRQGVRRVVANLVNQDAKRAKLVYMFEGPKSSRLSCLFRVELLAARRVIYVRLVRIAVVAVYQFIGLTPGAIPK